MSGEAAGWTSGTGVSWRCAGSHERASSRERAGRKIGCLMRANRAAVSLVALAAVGAGAIVGCGNGAGVASPRRVTTDPGAALDTAAGTAASSAPHVASAHGTDATEMQVTIRNGPDTGAHSAYAQTATCSYGLAAVGDQGSDAFANQFTDDSSAGLSAVQLSVPDTRSAAGSGTDRFTLSVTIGKPSKGRTYIIDTVKDGDRQAKKGGSGTVRIEDGGPTSIVAIKGESADGTALSVMIRCNQVLDADGQPR